MSVNDILLKELLKESVKKCYDDDFTLIRRAMEQASVARIFHYMQILIDTDGRYECLRQYNLDCEYNKNGEGKKGTSNCPNGTKPDLTLHERESNENNLLIVEFKSRKSKGKKVNVLNKYKDEVKLEDFTSPIDYDYQLGVWVKLNLKEPQFIYFKGGTKCN